MSKELTQQTIGKLLRGDEPRDAIHIAVYCVEAGEDLDPGQEVSLHQGRAVWAYGVDGDSRPLGIVDPYLTNGPDTGDHFWLFLYPNTITGLTHQWSHPAFPEGSTHQASAEVEEAKKGIARFAKDLGYTYDKLMGHANDVISGVDYISIGMNQPNDVLEEDWRGFWQAYALVTGKNVPEDLVQPIPYSCAC